MESEFEHFGVEKYLPPGCRGSAPARGVGEEGVGGLPQAPHQERKSLLSSHFGFHELTHRPAIG